MALKSDKWNVGDWVKYKSGISYYCIRKVYPNGYLLLASENGREYEVPEYKLERVTSYLTKEDEEKQNMTKLYQIKGTDTFGTRIGTNSENKAVVEIKGTGVVQLVDTADLIEVVPYTIKVTPVGGGNARHFAAKEGFFEKDDLFIYENALYIVSALGTKTEGVKELPSRKIAFTTITG
jgi:hypothetical protein